MRRWLLALVALPLGCATPTEPPSEQGTYKPDPPINPEIPPPGEAKMADEPAEMQVTEPAEAAPAPAESAPEGVDQSAMARDIREMLMNQQAAWNSGDIEGFWDAGEPGVATSS